MRYPASEKLEIIRLVEGSHLPTRRTLERLGIPRATFHRWYDRYRLGGPEALEDRRSRPSRVWNRIPDSVRQQIIDLALAAADLAFAFALSRARSAQTNSVARMPRPMRRSWHDSPPAPIIRLRWRSRRGII